MKNEIIIAELEKPLKGGIKTAFIMKKKEKDDMPQNVSRFSVTKMPDFSFSDGRNIEVVKPGKAKRPRIKTVIENTNPEL